MFTHKSKLHELQIATKMPSMEPSSVKFENDHVNGGLQIVQSYLQLTLHDTKRNKPKKRKNLPSVLFPAGAENLRTAFSTDTLPRGSVAAGCPASTRNSRAITPSRILLRGLTFWSLELGLQHLAGKANSPTPCGHRATVQQETSFAQLPLTSLHTSRFLHLWAVPQGPGDLEGPT